MNKIIVPCSGGKDSTVCLVKAIETVGKSNVVAVFNDTVHGAAGAIDIENSKYMIVTNLDDTNAVEEHYMKAIIDLHRKLVD